MATRLNGIATPFGKLDMQLKIAADGKTAHLARRAADRPLVQENCRPSLGLGRHR